MKVKTIIFIICMLANSVSVFGQQPHEQKTGTISAKWKTLFLGSKAKYSDETSFRVYKNGTYKIYNRIYSPAIGLRELTSTGTYLYYPDKKEIILCNEQQQPQQGFSIIKKRKGINKVVVRYFNILPDGNREMSELLMTLKRRIF